MLDTTHLDRLIDRLDDDADLIARKAAFDIEAQAKAFIQVGRKSGRLYRRGKRYHQASADGESPATDTGALVNSGQVRKVAPALWSVAFTVLYAWILEVLRNRPFLSKAVDKVRPTFEIAVKRLFEGV